jgi:hypothetical protein
MRWAYVRILNLFPLWAMSKLVAFQMPSLGFDSFTPFSSFASLSLDTLDWSFYGFVFLHFAFLHLDTLVAQPVASLFWLDVNKWICDEVTPNIVQIGIKRNEVVATTIKLTCRSVLVGVMSCCLLAQKNVFLLPLLAVAMGVLITQ